MNIADLFSPGLNNLTAGSGWLVWFTAFKALRVIGLCHDVYKYGRKNLLV